MGAADRDSTGSTGRIRAGCRNAMETERGQGEAHGPNPISLLRALVYKKMDN